MSSICRKRCGSQAAISSGQRVAIARRPALEHVRDEDVGARRARSRRAACRAASRPARRTARPAGPRGSPGASPTNIRSASGLPGAEHDLRAALRERATGAPAVSSAYARSAAARSTASIGSVRSSVICCPSLGLHPDARRHDQRTANWTNRGALAAAAGAAAAAAAATAPAPLKPASTPRRGRRSSRAA